MKRSPIKRFVGLLRKGLGLRRSPMTRKTPMERAVCTLKGGNLQRNGPLPKRSAKRQVLQDRWNAFTAEKIKAGCGCIVCSKPGTATDRLFGHHILPLGRGGRWTLDNHGLVHAGCHRTIHDNPKWAEGQGFLLSSKAAA